MGSPIDILIVGHSWVEGAFKGEEEKVRAFFKAKGIEVGQVTVISKVGASSAYAKEQIEGLYLKYDYVLLLSGVNDGLSKPKNVSLGLVELYSAAQNHATQRVFICNIPPFREYPREIPRVNADVESAVAKADVIDLFSFMEKKGIRTLHPPDYEPVRLFILSQIAVAIAQKSTGVPKLPALNQ